MKDILVIEFIFPKRKRETKDCKKKIPLIKMTATKKRIQLLALITSPVRFARVQGNAFVPESAQRILTDNPGLAPKNNYPIDQRNY